LGWSLSDLGIAGFTLIGVFPALLIISVFFLIGGIGLYVAGLVSAMIYFLAGVGVLWILKVLSVFKHPLGYLSLLILPVAALWGWGVDNLTFLAMMPSPANWLASQPQIALPMNDVNGFPVVFSLNFESLGILLTGTSLFVGVASLVLTLRSRKR